MRGYLQECGQFKDSCIPSNSSLGCLLTPETCSHEAICTAGNLTFGVDDPALNNTYCLYYNLEAGGACESYKFQVLSESYNCLLHKS